MPIMHKRRSPGVSLTRVVKTGWVAFCVLFVVACHLDMYNQPRNEPYTENTLFPNNAVARPIEPNTVSRSAQLDPVLTTGEQNGQFVTTNPLPVDDQVLARGRDRYNIVCITCHGANADGRGIVAGYFRPPPASMYLERLRTAPDGYLFQVITHGKGQMFPQAHQLTPEDRWAVIAYIRQLQETPPEGVQANPTEAPAEERPPGTEQPNEPELP